MVSDTPEEDSQEKTVKGVDDGKAFSVIVQSASSVGDMDEQNVHEGPGKVVEKESLRFDGGQPGTAACMVDGSLREESSATRR